MDREKLFEPQIPSLSAFSQQEREEPQTTFKTVLRAEPETIDWASCDVVRVSSKGEPTITGFARYQPSGYFYAVTEPEYVGELPAQPNLTGLLETWAREDTLVWAALDSLLERELSMWTDGADTVIAYSATDAVRVWEDHVGCPYEGDERNPAMCWVQTRKKLDDDFELWLDDSCSEKKKMTVREWIAEHGRGWFCTTEF